MSASKACPFKFGDLVLLREGMEDPDLRGCGHRVTIGGVQATVFDTVSATQVGVRLTQEAHAEICRRHRSYVRWCEKDGWDQWELWLHAKDLKLVDKAESDE